MRGVIKPPEPQKRSRKILSREKIVDFILKYGPLRSRGGYLDLNCKKNFPKT